MLARIGLLSATVFTALAALAHAQGQHPGSASFTLTDERFTLDGSDGAKRVTVALGATVRFSYPRGARAHNVHIERVGPSCTQLAGHGAGNVSRILPNPPEGPGWVISCRFDVPGIYHFASDEQGTLNGVVRVANADGTIPPETNPPGEPPEDPPVSNGPGTKGSGGGGSGGDGTTPTSGPGARRAAAWSAARSQRGTRIRVRLTGGSVRSTVTLEALARRADLRVKRKAKRVRVGRVRKTIPAGARRTVSVPLDANARSALNRLGRLKLTLRVKVSGQTATRTVTLRAQR